MKNYYEVLGVDEDASQEQIKVAFRKLARKFHPDRHEQNVFFIESFKEINEANQVLSDDDSRASYDFKLMSYNTHLKNQSLQNGGFFTVGSNRQRFMISGLKKAGLTIVVFTLMAFVVDTILEDKDLSFNTSISDNMGQKQFDVLEKPSAKPSRSNSKIKPGEQSLRTKSNLRPGSVSSSQEDKTRVDLPVNTTASGSNNIEPFRSDEPNKVDMFIELTEPIKAKILNEINQAKAENHNQSNCVQVCGTTTSNIENGSTLADFLKDNGFSIAGRKLSSESVHGVRVDASSGCISLVLGKF